jgi:hypothetical protein
MNLNQKRLASIERLLHQSYLSAWAIAYWNKVKLQLMAKQNNK